MIVLTSLADARILAIGAGDLVDAILDGLSSHGISQITTLERAPAAVHKASSAINGNHKETPQAIGDADRDFLKSFDLVLSANQPRSFEVALSNLRWPKDEPETGPDLPMIVMRNATNACKMRCQYRELPQKSSTSAKFVSLSMDLPPWTGEKRKLVASVLNEELDIKSSAFQAYLSAGSATIKFQKSRGSWPEIKDVDDVQTFVEKRQVVDDPEVRRYIECICRGGLAEAQETTAMLARIVVHDAVNLLTGTGQPVNSTTMEDCIQILSNAS